MSGLDGLRLEIPMHGDHVELILETDAGPVIVELDAEESMVLSLKLSGAAHMLEPETRPFTAPAPRAASSTPESAPTAPRQLDTSRAKELVPCPYCGRRYVAGTGLGGHIRRAHKGWDDKPPTMAEETPPVAPAASNGHVQDPRIDKLVQDLTRSAEDEQLDLPEPPEPEPARPAFHRLVDERNTPAGICFACECGWVTPALGDRSSARRALGDHIDDALAPSA